MSALNLNINKPTTLTLAPAQARSVVAPTLTLASSQAASVLTLAPTAPTTLTLAPTSTTLTLAAPTANSYKQYDHRTHVYMKSDTYIGSDERVAREEWVYDNASKSMKNCQIDFTPGCERLYLEILTNASDNVGRSRRANVDPGKIDIKMSNSTISVTNYGLPIPVEIHPTEKVYVPQMIFGSLLTSSNYEVDRHEAGTNGIGAKAANIFSTDFMVVVHDNIRKLKYTQIWRENMKKRDDPIIEKYEGKDSSVQITYKMDFARFKYPVPNGIFGGYPPEAFALYMRHAIDISFTSKTAVTFNDVEFNFSNIRDYARLYFGDVVETAIVHYQWPPGTEIIKKKKGQQVAKNPAITPIVELIAIDTPDAGHHVSFVNCMMTRDGGVHVNAAVKAVGDSAVQNINDTVIKKLTKHNKGKELDVKEKRSHTININDVKPHISILLAVKVLNPKFTSQTKTNLSAPIPKIDVDDEELKAMGKWQLIDRLYAALDAKQFAASTKTDGKMTRYIKLKRGVDANFSGKEERHRCVLYITEGNSGAGYANTLIGLIPSGRDYIGVLPMKGKSLNVMNADRFQIEKNPEISELKKMLGLREGADYLDQAHYNSLRYGAVMIMADSDVDGKHIIGLILNFFHCRYPSLLARGFVMYYRTPTIRVTFGKTVNKFYTQREYDEWKKITPNYEAWKHKYFKGLGSSTDAQVKDDYNAPRVVHCVYDNNAPAAMQLAFDKKFADQRKDWICKWKSALGVDNIEMQPISMFINHELILFSIADVQRSIPKLMDGFKESHRKIIYGAYLKWKINSVKKKAYEEFKVAQFGNFVADKACYHHGETILSNVIVGMAQDFMGSNNITWFTKGGQYGTRFQGGKDAANTRYTFTHPERLAGYILRKEDLPILKYVIDEGKSVEPENYYPVVPTILINGAQGIGTGYSTFVPNHNPVDIIKWLKLKLMGYADSDLPEVLPWYRGFEGTIKVIDRSKKKKASDKVNMTVIQQLKVAGQIVSSVEKVQADEDEGIVDESIDNEEDIDDDDGDKSRQLLSMISQGKYTVHPNGTIVITELPIGRWPYNYHKWLESLRENKTIVDYRDNSCGDKVYFEIYGMKKDMPINHKTLKLQKSFGMSNMMLLDENNRPHRYNNSFEILTEFYNQRLPVYQARKNYYINNLKDEITLLHNKIRFILAVINGEILVMNRRKAEIMENMDKMAIPRDLLNVVKIVNCTYEEVEEMRKNIADKENQMRVLEAISPQQMWMNDLEEFEKMYNQVYRSDIVLKLK